MARTSCRCSDRATSPACPRKVFGSATPAGCATRPPVTILPITPTRAASSPRSHRDSCRQVTNGRRTGWTPIRAGYRTDSNPEPEWRAKMTRTISTVLVCGLFLLPGLPAVAQSTPSPAMNASDQLAWQFFIQVNTRAGGSNALFETWASDSDTFKVNPQFPTAPAPLALREPAVP